MQFIAAAFLSSASVRSNFLSFSTAGENTTFKILPQVYKHGDLILQIKYLKVLVPVLRFQMFPAYSVSSDSPLWTKYKY